jgi:hypothetical protein
MGLATSGFVVGLDFLENGPSASSKRMKLVYTKR